MKESIKQILDYSYEHQLSHIGSCLTALPILEEIYKLKKLDEKFILSSGHAHLAHAVVMSQQSNKPISEFMKVGIHCDRENGCDVSTGSLGMGITIATGLAIADRSRDVWCLITDGEAQEGSVYESLRVAQENNLTNLKVYCNANYFGAYGPINVDLLEKRLNAFFPVNVVRTDMSDYPEYLQGLSGHYKVLNKDEYREITNK